MKPEMLKLRVLLDFFLKSFFFLIFGVNLPIVKTQVYYIKVLTL